ncbi:hypothetical protein [Amycolatopsis sp. H20-H5]|uniref:hypothetical protein n=1 Tax=Amycolatopsis sp. H20-H5 TaxID=3046309 RepID=UPI002DB5C92B|nr:hypothetical protein [Amycolatopsis sp. H20-H5]MEC3982323.1 hypothetical protein [Amycolatopsis sp. H20-H5]
MSDLESRYRSVLRLLPLSYREKWADDMVTTFLDSTLPEELEEAEYVAEFGRPGRAEVASVVALAVRLRFAGSAGPARYSAWGGAVRLAALAGLLVNAVSGVIGVELLYWADGRVPWLGTPPVRQLGGPAQATWALSGLLWTFAFLLLLNGHRRAARIAAGLGLVRGLYAAVAAMIDSVSTGAPLFFFSHWLELAVSALVVLLLSAFHSDAEPVRPRWWLVALAAAVVLNPMPPLMAFARPDFTVPLDWTGLCCLALAAGGVAYLAMPSWRTPSRTLALALLSAGALVLRLALLLDFATFSGRMDLGGATLPVFGIEAVLVLAVGVTAGMLASRAVRPLGVR